MCVCITIETHSRIKSTAILSLLAVIASFWGDTCSVNYVGMGNEQINIRLQIKNHLNFFRMNTEG